MLTYADNLALLAKTGEDMRGKKVRVVFREEETSVKSLVFEDNGLQKGRQGKRLLVEVKREDTGDSEGVKIPEYVAKE